jgi:hypothetical protein
LFNVDDLCPTNAPKRCEWCKGPYHIRKRCPKLATLAHENDKKIRTTNNHNQQVYTDNRSQFPTNNFQEDYYYYSNTHGQYNHPNEHNYPQSAPPNHRPFRYGKDFYNSSEHQGNNSHRLYQQNYSKKGCFYCRDPGHIKAHCPALQKNNSIQRHKTSS